MDLFKSILSKLHHKQSEANNLQTHETEITNDSTSHITSSKNGTADISDVSLWSFGYLVKTLVTKSETVFETYRCDLKEFEIGFRKELDLFSAVVSRAVTKLSKPIDAVSSAIDLGKEVFAPFSDVDESNSSIANHESDVLLENVTEEKSKMELRCRDMEWWMRRRQLPSVLRQRVRHHERQKWMLMGGEDEMELLKDLPEGLRHDIKHFLFLEFIRMVPLFHNFDDIILDNICDRVKSLVFSKNERIIREGDPIQSMVFIVKGRVKHRQNLSTGVIATSILAPGCYLGEELLSWCLKRPYIKRLPTSSATFTCMGSTEAFGLDANHLCYVIEQFRYKFANERLKRTIRYYLSNWRTWAAVYIQLSWRRYTMRMRGSITHVTQEDGGNKCVLQKYATIFMSFRPHDHLE